MAGQSGSGMGGLQSAPMDRAGGGGGLPRLQNMPQLSPLGMGGTSSYGAGRFGAQFNPYQARSYQPQTYQPQQLGAARLYGPQAGSAPSAGVSGASMGGMGGGEGQGNTSAPSGPGSQSIDPNGFSITAPQAFGMVANPIGTMAAASISNAVQSTAMANQAQQGLAAQMAAIASQTDTDPGVNGTVGNDPTDASNAGAVNGMDAASDAANAANAANAAADDGGGDDGDGGAGGGGGGSK